MAHTESENPCPACGWSLSKQSCCSYSSHVNLFYGASERGVWSLGSDFILKERPNLPPKSEVLNIRYVRKHTTIPVPTVVKDWVDENDRRFVLMERAKGQTLRTAWPTMSPEDKELVADQVAECLVQLRKLQSNQMQAVDGGGLYSGWLFLRGSQTPHGPFSSDQEMWNDMALALNKLPEKALTRFWNRLPPSSPYTLTHGDLNIDNIIVKHGSLVAILDWETSGYFPVWWEYVAASIGLGSIDGEWKGLLRKRINPYLEEREFWLDFYALHRYPELDEKGEVLLNSLLQE